MATGTTTYANEGPVVEADTITNANITTSIHHGNIISNPLPETESIRFNVNSPEINFVGRLPELRRLEAAMQASQKSSATKMHTIVISGLGGVGKTQLVRKFVDDNQSSYKNIIWINAERSEMINESFERLADKLNVPIISAKGKVKIFEFIVEDVLNKISKNKTLFVYDNVEKIKDIKFALTVQQIENQCHVIITTRIQEWGGQIDVISVKVWTIEDAVNYVSQTLNHPYDSDDDNQKLIVDSDEDIKLLVEKLQYFPLALRQATAYIKYERMEQNFGIAEYIAKFDTQEMLDSKLFLESPLNVYQKTTFTTWSVTIDAIQEAGENGTLAVRILYIISYFDPDNIYRDIFTHLTYRSENLPRTEEFYSEQNIRSAVRLLINYSMVDSQPQHKQSVLSIHRLVQLVIKVKCKESHQAETTLQDALSLFRNLFEVNQEKFNSSLTHSASVFITSLTYTNLVKEFGLLPLHILMRLNDLSRYSAAKAFGDKIFQTFIYIFGEDHLVTLVSKTQTAYSYREIGDHTKALQIYQEVFEKQINISGENHPEKLATKCNIAYCHRLIGEYTKALQIYREVFEKQKNNLGENHSQTLVTKSEIANCHSSRGDHTKPLEMFQEIFEKQINILGHDHPDTLITKSNIANSYRKLGDLTKALQMYEKVYEKQINLLKEDHPQTLWTKFNIAYCHRLIGDHKKSLQMFQEVFEKQINNLGEDHPVTLVTKSNIANIHMQIDDHRKALVMYQEIFEKETNISGENHPETLATKCNVAYCHREIGDHKKALQMFQEVFEKQVLGEDHLQTLQTKSNIAYCHMLIGDHIKALQMYQEIFEKQINILGEDHSDTLITKSNIASSYRKLGDHTTALQMYQEVFEKQINISGENHPETLATKRNIAYCHRLIGDHKKALQMYQEVFEKQRNNLGEHHPETLVIKSNIAYCHRLIGDHTTALQMFQEVFEKQINILGENHPQTLITKSQIPDNTEKLCKIS